MGNLICSQDWHSVLIQLPAQDGIVRICVRHWPAPKQPPILGAEPYYNHETPAPGARAEGSPPCLGGWEGYQMAELWTCCS